jgi:hypothetical protein
MTEKAGGNKGNPNTALSVAIDAAAQAVRSEQPLSLPFAGGVLSTILGLTTLVDELARQLGRPELALPTLRQVVGYLDHAITREPTLATFQEGDEYVSYFRRRLDELDSIGQQPFSD